MVSPDVEDPTIVGDGIKCANQSVCVAHKCRRLSSLSDSKRCTSPCHNGGVCNNNGNCHCPPGWACPFCELRGMGGSIDSGAACVYSDKCENCSPMSLTTKILLVVFVGVLPSIVVVLSVLYCSRHRYCFTTKSSSEVVSSREEVSFVGLQGGNVAVVGQHATKQQSDEPHIEPHIEPHTTKPHIVKPSRPPPAAPTRL